MNRVKTLFISLLLLIILIIQSYTMLNASSVGYMLDNENDIENNDVDYTLIAMSAEIIKQYLSDDGKSVMLIKDPGGKYETGIAYYYYAYALYPFEKVNDITYSKSFEDLKKGNIDYLFNNKIAKYYIIFGKDISIKNITTNNDINLYKVNDKDSNKLDFVIDFKYDLYSMFALTSDKNNFLDDCEIFKNMINTYWDFNSIDLIRNFSIDLYDNGYTEISEKYLEYYYNTVDTLNYEIDLRLGNINYENKRYDKSIKYYKSALNSSGCDTEYLNFKIYELEKMVIE